MLSGLLSPINDISTTPDDPPRFQAVRDLPAHKGRELSYPRGNADKQRKLYPDLQPLKSSLSAAELFSRAVSAAKMQEGWETIFMSASQYRLEAVATTKMLRFRDDLVIEVRPEMQGSSLHMRSRSRLGRNDFGANAKRIRAFLSSLNLS